MQICEGQESGALSEIGESGSDCGPIVVHWTVVDIVGRPIEALVCAPLQEGVLVDGPSRVEDRGEESVGGRGVVRGRGTARVVGEETGFYGFQRIGV